MKKRNLFLGLVLVGSVVLMAGCAGKMNHKGMEKKVFLKYDENSDGYINQEEYVSRALERFKRSDMNDDDKITKKELEESRISKMFPNIVESYFKENDLNTDGVVAKYELIQGVDQEFVASDIDGDKKLTFDEMKTYRIEKKFMSMDINSDGLLSKNEFKHKYSAMSKIGNYRE